MEGGPRYDVSSKGSETVATKGVAIEGWVKGTGAEGVKGRHAMVNVEEKTIAAVKDTVDGEVVDPSSVSTGGPEELRQGEGDAVAGYSEANVAVPGGMHGEQTKNGCGIDL